MALNGLIGPFVEEKFKKFDTDEDGKLSTSEYAQFIKKCNQS
jgi:Ca2+-binding EF-hand superfamily protein